MYGFWSVSFIQLMRMKTEIAVFGGGCFWCTEAVFKMLKGVHSVMPGYAGGSEATGSGPSMVISGRSNRERSRTTGGPTYEQVSSGRTGYAEVIEIEYDPDVIPFEKLLTVFFATHDPTTPNQQGADVGTQYRSIILYTNEAQREAAEQFIEKVNAPSEHGDPAVTEIEPLKKFYPAEDYHRDYYARNKNAGYCQVVINPKLKKVQEKFAELLEDKT